MNHSGFDSESSFTTSHRMFSPTRPSLSQALAEMARPNLSSCYQKIGFLQDKLQPLQERFGFSDVTGLIHSAQIDLQQVQLLSLTLQPRTCAEGEKWSYHHYMELGSV